MIEVYKSTGAPETVDRNVLLMNMKVDKAMHAVQRLPSAKTRHFSDRNMNMLDIIRFGLLWKFFSRRACLQQMAKICFVCFRRGTMTASAE